MTWWMSAYLTGVFVTVAMGYLCEREFTENSEVHWVPLLQAAVAWPVSIPIAMVLEHLRWSEERRRR